MERKYETNKNLKGEKDSPRKPWRSLTIEENGLVWGWQIRGGCVLILLPDGKKIIPIQINTFHGLTYDQLADIVHNGGYVPIEPSGVRMWIITGFSLYKLDDSVLKLIPDIYRKRYYN